MKDERLRGCPHCFKRELFEALDVTNETGKSQKVKCSQCGHWVRFRFFKNKIKWSWYANDQPKESV